MTYTINGKPYTEFDINLRCAELKEFKLCEGQHYKSALAHWVDGCLEVYDPCNDPSDTWPIIEKCFDELMAAPCFFKGLCMTKWECIIDEWECTKPIAACICYIELNKEMKEPLPFGTPHGCVYDGERVDKIDKNKTFYHDAKPVKSNYDYCMFDSLTDKTRDQVTMLSCNCPKCTVR